MSESISLATHPLTDSAGEDGARAAVVPWYVWSSALAVTSAMVGLHWDIAWHRTIGRDTFWTPAHMAIQLCGVLAGLTCGILILSTTFSKQPGMREASVKVLGFRGPLGAFIAAWGGVAMVVSAPFDNWWHNAYGLDVKILSPPHMVLAAGLLAVEFGTLILILGAMNRAPEHERQKLDALYVYVGGMIIVQIAVIFVEYSFRGLMHSAIFYRVVCLAIPAPLIGVARASRYRWAASIVMAVYTLFWAGMLWILPLFPAQPKLGPVYNQVTQFVPMDFPLALVVPAVGLDLLFMKALGWNKWLVAMAAGTLFLTLLVAAQWPFAEFLNSPLARNWFFGAHYRDYMTPPDAWWYYTFVARERTLAEFWGGMALALLYAIGASRLGLACGDWMKEVRR